MSGYRVGIDIGGTFTDIVFMDENGQVLTKKISSSVENYAEAIVEGLAQVFKAHEISSKNGCLAEQKLFFCFQFLFFYIMDIRDRSSITSAGFPKF